MLRRRPNAPVVLIRAQVHCTTRHHAAVVQSLRVCSGPFGWKIAACATGRDFTTQPRRRCGDRCLSGELPLHPALGRFASCFRPPKRQRHHPPGTGVQVVAGSSDVELQAAPTGRPPWTPSYRPTRCAWSSPAWTVSTAMRFAGRWWASKTSKCRPSRTPRAQRAMTPVPPSPGWRARPDARAGFAAIRSTGILAHVRVPQASSRQMLCRQRNRAGARSPPSTPQTWPTVWGSQCPRSGGVS